jgi:hypothetical protein
MIDDNGDHNWPGNWQLPRQFLNPLILSWAFLEGLQGQIWI